MSRLINAVRFRSNGVANAVDSDDIPKVGQHEAIGSLIGGWTHTAFLFRFRIHSLLYLEWDGFFYEISFSLLLYPPMLELINSSSESDLVGSQESSRANDTSHTSYDHQTRASVRDWEPTSDTLNQ